MPYKTLDELIEKAIIDCYDEYEQVCGFVTTLESEVTFPFMAKVVGEEVEVVGIDQNDLTVEAVCKRKGKKYKVDLLNLEYDSKKIKGGQWLDAYRKWAE